MIRTILFLTLCLVLMSVASNDSTRVTQDRMTERVILTAEDFKKLNCENVGDALQNLSGVTVSTLGEVSLRDVSSSKVVIVFDGQRLNTAGTTGVRVNTISIENIEKIELLRGGRSAQYGADAVGGVILITSKSKKEQKTVATFGARASYGAYNQQIYGLNHSLSVSKYNYLISYKRETWDGDFLYTDPYGERLNLVNNHQSSHFAFVKAGRTLGENQNLNASFTYYNADNGTPGMVDNLTPNARIRFDNKSYNLNYDHNAIFKDFTLKLQSYFLDYETKFDEPDGLVPVHSDHDNYAVGIDAQQSGKLSKSMDISYGYTFRNDRISSTDVGKKKRDTHSAFATVTFAQEMNTLISSWDVALALRYDAPSDFDPEFSPRLSLKLNRAGKLNSSLQSHITRSYRAPTFNDLYWPRDAFAIGNPNLRPEIGYNFDLGLNLSYPVAFVQSMGAVNFFYNKATDLILWAQDPALNNLWTPSNISESLTKGIELSMTFDLFKNKILLNSEYTFMEALDKGPDPSRHDRYIIYKPKNKLDLTGTLRLYKFEWNFMYHYLGLRYTNAANTAWLPAINLMDINLTYRFLVSKIQWDLVMEITNLTDEDFQYVLNTAEPGRLYKISLGFNI
jgi:outer membrane cobalamin receptor